MTSWLIEGRRSCEVSMAAAGGADEGILVKRGGQLIAKCRLLRSSDHRDKDRHGRNQKQRILNGASSAM